MKAIKKLIKRFLIFFIEIAILAFLWSNGSEIISLFQTPDQYASTEHGWNLILINRDNQIPEDYPIELTELSNGEKVDTRMYPSLQLMFDDMRMQGVYPTVSSGYRTDEKQKQLMDEKIEELIGQGYSRFEAKKEALRWVAPVDHSEHQIGLAIDINAVNGKSTNAQVYKWLAENAWKYGFILRYPEDKTELTQINYEPWHYRYVGIEVATEIVSNGYCLEEYVATID